MFRDTELFPTPPEVIETMLMGEDISNKIILEPSAGKGDLVDYLLHNGASSVLACENNADLRKIVESKCKVIEGDFLTLTSDKISHIDMIIMNPPFSNGDAHILHAFNIAPAGCRIIALCNLQTIKNPYSKTRKELTGIIESYGSFEDIGDCFNDSERQTGVNVALVRLQKAGEQTNEFEGFFMEDEPEEQGENGIMNYNVVRDLVNRYVGAVKIFDEQLNAAVKMNSLTSGFYSTKMGMSVSVENKPIKRNEFKKEMQKCGWNFIFDKLNMKKYATKGLKEDINKFVETQQNIPFTMKNIYHMLTVINGTQGSRMDKAILEVFDKLTTHHHDNRHNVEGWKTNSHYLMGEKFILPGMCSASKWHSGNKIDTNYGNYFEMVDDLLKALCYISGDNYDNFTSLYSASRMEHEVIYDNKIELFSNDINYSGAYARVEELKKQGVKAEYRFTRKEYGNLFDWGYFEIRAYKKGTMHFRFKDLELWGRFNQRVAKLKGYPLYEYKAPSREQKPSAENKNFTKPTILATIKLKVA